MAVLALVLRFATAGAQAPLERATMNISVDPGARTAAVALDYVLAASATTDTLDLAAILFDNVRIGGIGATLDGEPLLLDGLDREPDERRRIVGSIVLPAGRTSGRSLVVSYNVLDLADAGTVRIPVLAALRPPEEALPGTFVAHLHLPSAWQASDAMPAGLRLAEDREGVRRYDVGLQVLPAMIAFQLTEGPPAFSVMRLLLNALAMLFLVAAGRVGWRHFVTGS